MARQYSCRGLPAGRVCVVRGCLEPATGYRRLCERHRKTDQRHGHPEQDGITIGELGGYRRAAVEFIESRQDAERVWSVLEEHWQAFAEWARGQIRYLSKRAYPRHSMRALQSVQAVADEANPRDVMATLIAFAWLWLERPKRFRSDRAARFQAARVLRRMTDAHVGRAFSPNDGQVKRYYRDASPRVLDELGTMIWRVLMPACLNVVRKIESEREAERQRVNEMRRVIAGAPEEQSQEAEHEQRP
jgi:hypothetical protein